MQANTGKAQIRLRKAEVGGSIPLISTTYNALLGLE